MTAAGTSLGTRRRGTPALWRFAATIAAGAAASLVLASGGLAAPPPPSDVWVDGGEESWRPSRTFFVYWSVPSGLAAMHYRVRDPWGTVIREWKSGVHEFGERIVVPATPGAYRFEVWLENAAGEQGAAAKTWLRFDDSRPPAVEPQPRATWVGRAGFPLAIRLSLPAGSAPVSGIRGFAVSVDRSPAGEPCVVVDRCEEGEIDLVEPNDDVFPIDDLREGTSYLHAVAISGAGISSAEVGSATIRVDKTDPLVSLGGAPSGWTNRALTLVAKATDARSGMAPGGGATPFTAIRVDGGRPVTATGDSVATSLATEGVHRVDYYARDLAGNVADGSVVGDVHQPQPATATVRIDRTPPRVAFANAQDPTEPETIRARVADDLSGAESGRGWIGVRQAGSGDRFAPLPALPATNGELRAHWESDSYPPGAYEFEATGYDRAGNEGRSVKRAYGAPMILSNPLKAPTAIDAAFTGRTLRPWRCTRRHGRRRCRRVAGRPAPWLARRTVPYGRSVLLAGRLRSAAGSPLGGSRAVQVVESFPAGLPSRASIAWTDAAGAFSLRLPPGPSREVRVAFAGTPTRTRSVSRPLELRVRSIVRLHASARVAKVGGAPLVFRGRVEAAPGTIPPGGVPVELQFRLAGLPWSEFRTVQTDRHGRFRYAYRFSDDDSRGVRFRFRAHVAARDGWPYEPAGSLPVVVRGI